MKFSRFLLTLSLTGAVAMGCIVVNTLYVNQLFPTVEINSITTVSTDTSHASSAPVLSQTVPSLYFVGDVMLGRHVEYLLRLNGAEYPYKNLAFLRDEPSFVVANFEASVPDIHVKTPNFGFSFSVDKELVAELKNAGFTHLSLANNHALDFGHQGLLETQRNLTEANFTVFGDPQLFSTTSSITTIELGSTTIALIGLHTLFTQPTTEEIETVVTSASEVSDHQVVFVHWGIEYETKPSVAQRNLARELIFYGADLIVGHHPHVVQSIELIDGVVVYFSLGNFIFDQYFSREVQEGLVLQLSHMNTEPEINLIPVSSKESYGQPKPLKAADRAVFLQQLASHSSSELRPWIASGTIPFVPNLASSSETAIMGR
jgi:gamma-polyglutamate biosynthesis protein CapA